MLHQANIELYTTKSPGTLAGSVTPSLVTIKDATLQPYSKQRWGFHSTKTPAKKPATKESPAPVVSTTGAFGLIGCT